MIRNLILDWSGTLADDLACVLAAVNGVLGHHGRPALSPEEFRQVFRLPPTEFCQKMLPGENPEMLKQLYLRYFPAEPRAVPLLPHAREFLEHGAVTGRRMVLLSGVPQEHFEAQSKAHGVRGFFEDAWCGVDGREALRQLVAHHGMAAGETAFISGMGYNVAAAHAAGVLSIATVTGYERVETLMRASPGLLVQDLSLLPRLLGSLPPGGAASHGAVHPLATVGALILDSRGQVLLLRTHKWSHRWGIPGGKIKRGETSEEALRREIREETGLELQGIRLVMVQDCIEPPEFERSAHFLLLNYLARCEGDGPAVVLNDEAEDFRWLTWDEAARQDLNIPTRILLEEISLRGGPDLR